MKSKQIVCLILSHGRPNDIKTINALSKAGYTGEWYIVVDNTDKTIEEYKKVYGDDKIVIFDKYEIAAKVDHGDNFNNLRTTTHVRNALFDVSEQLGYEYFIALDDDYTAFSFRFDNNYAYKHRALRNIDLFFEESIEFMEKNHNVASICMAQGGDYIGGPNGGYGQNIKFTRKAMNSFICSTKRRFWFFSRLNEDVNTYMTLGSRGMIFFTTNQVSLNQVATQATSGGMTEAYLDGGTYVKSFYTVMYMPSCTKVSEIGTSQKRLHHSIKWKNAVPVILSENYKK